MNEKLLKEIDALIARAKAPDNPHRDLKFKMRPGYAESLPLNKIIKTKEQADAFMKMLRAL